MNFVWIWIGEEPTKKQLKYVKRSMEKAGKKDNCIMVSEKDFLPKTTWMNVNELINELKEKHPLINTHWDKLAVQNKADVVRFYLATKIEDMLYLDFDIELKKIPEFEQEDKPYFTRCTYPGTKQFDMINCDVHLFYNNNQFGFFNKFLTMMVDVYKTETSATKYMKFVYCFNKYLRRFSSCYIIDGNFYEHYNEAD